MTLTESIKTAKERNIKAVKLRPSAARGSEIMTAVTDGNGVTIAADGEDSIRVDMGKNYGGAGTTPGPGFFLRAALASCLSQGYVDWAAYLGVPVDCISMEVHTEYDVTGALGIDESVTCGYTSLRILIEVKSPAPRADIERVIETTERRSFMHAVLQEKHKIEWELRVTSSAAA